MVHELLSTLWWYWLLPLICAAIFLWWLRRQPEKPEPEHPVLETEVPHHPEMQFTPMLQGSGEPVVVAAPVVMEIQEQAQHQTPFIGGLNAERKAD